MNEIVRAQPSIAAEIWDACVDPQGEPLGPPTGWRDLALGLGMTNFDHAIDDGFEEALRAGGVFGRHAAWDFNGKVWYADGRFFEQVWRYHAPVQTFAAESLRELMELVNDRYGWA